MGQPDKDFIALMGLVVVPMMVTVFGSLALWGWPPPPPKEKRIRNIDKVLAERKESHTGRGIRR